jgi:pyruvate kinase
LQHLEEIIKESDGVMVARGDLGVETDLATVVLKQKEIIRLSNLHGKIVITATQMLESMIEHPYPTRAEVSDITNAIFDGTDALMLSGETAVGKYPIEAVAMMARIAEKTEDSIDYEKFLTPSPYSTGIPDAIAHAACILARRINAQALLVTTLSGTTVRMIARYRPLPPIIAVTPNKARLMQLNLVWGVYPLLIPHSNNTDTVFMHAKRAALYSGIVKKGDTVVMCAGMPLGKPAGTNLIKIITL